MWLRIAATGSIAGTSDLVAKIRRGSARRAFDGLAITRGHIALLEKFRRQFPEIVLRHQALIRRRLSQVYLSLGVALHDSGDRRAALSAFRTALTVDPRNPRVYYRLGLLLLTPRQVLALKQVRATIGQHARGSARGQAVVLSERQAQ